MAKKWDEKKEDVKEAIKAVKTVVEDVKETIVELRKSKPINGEITKYQPELK